MIPTGEPSERKPLIRATIVEYDDRVDECTLHPVDPEDDKQITEWITAQQGSYTSLDACR
jgi:hypothetical protein